MNKVILEGRITQDVVIREIGMSRVSHITLAINRTWRDKSGVEQKETSFIKCVLWNQCAQQVDGLKKGSKIYLEGRLKQNKWIDKETQKERSELIVMVNLVKPGQQSVPSKLDTQPLDFTQAGNNFGTFIFEKDSNLLNSAELDDLPF